MKLKSVKEKYREINLSMKYAVAAAKKNRQSLFLYIRWHHIPNLCYPANGVHNIATR